MTNPPMAPSAILLAALLSAPAALAQNQQPPRQPNLLIILADDMGYGDLSCFGSKQIQTPNIDALAARGVRCTQGYVSGTVCSPSRAGLMTGRYQSRFGHEHNIGGAPVYYSREHIGLPTDEVTIADRLKKVGYHTAAIGKWHLGGTEDRHPNSRGFDYYFGRFKGHGYFPKVEKKQIYRQREPVTAIDVPYTTDWYTKETKDFIDRVPDGEPWFVYLAHDTPHTPLQAKQQDLQKFAHIANKRRRTMCAMQHCLDENVGQLIAHLRKKQMLDDTLIVFLSDNGGIVKNDTQSINAPLRGQKSTFYEGGFRVPVIVSWPNGLPSGKTYERPVMSLDLMPTFLAAAGKPFRAPKGKKAKIYDGVDLLPFLRGERRDATPHERMYWRITHRGAAYRNGDWKIVRLGHRPTQLFHIADDISEQRDLAGRHPERLAAMLLELAAWEEQLRATPRWFSGNGWRVKSRKKHDMDYPLEQPGG